MSFQNLKITGPKTISEKPFLWFSPFKKNCNLIFLRFTFVMTTLGTVVWKLFFDKMQVNYKVPGSTPSLAQLMSCGTVEQSLSRDVNISKIWRILFKIQRVKLLKANYLNNKIQERIYNQWLVIVANNQISCPPASPISKSSKLFPVIQNWYRWGGGPENS